MEFSQGDHEIPHFFTFQSVSLFQQNPSVLVDIGLRGCSALQLSVTLTLSGWRDEVPAGKKLQMKGIGVGIVNLLSEPAYYSMFFRGDR